MKSFVEGIDSVINRVYTVYIDIYSIYTLLRIKDRQWY